LEVIMKLAETALMVLLEDVPYDVVTPNPDGSWNVHFTRPDGSTVKVDVSSAGYDPDGRLLLRVVRRGLVTYVSAQPTALHAVAVR
jgi:hypothetical protein